MNQSHRRTHGVGHFIDFARGRGGRGYRRIPVDGIDTCTLDAVRGGDVVEIVGVDDQGARIHALRFGMAEGSQARCVTRIPAGPIVMRSGRQEIAVGRKLAQRIRVRRIDTGDIRKAG